MKPYRHPVSRIAAVLLALSGMFGATDSRAVLALAGPGPAPTAALAFSAPANYIVHGAHINPTLTYPMEISHFESRVGKNVGIIMYFLAWTRMTEDPNTHAGPCDDGFLPRNAFPGSPPPDKPGDAGGRAVMLTWEPLPGYLPNGSPNPSVYDNILNHQFDTLIDICADELKAWSNKTFLIRFMHEMNITDSPWWAGYSYNQRPDGAGDTDKYKQVWRYVWQRFHNRGVTNVQWVWSPNYVSNPIVAWNDLNKYYPGDQYVDWIGLSGFNWMGVIPFQSYSTLYNSVLADLQCRYRKPIMHGEIGSAPYSTGDSPPNKEGWITNAYQSAQTFPLVRAVVWFNDFARHDVSMPDFRVWFSQNDYSSAPPPGPSSVTDAYKNAVTGIPGKAFTSSYNSAQLLNPPMTRCPGDAVSGNGVLGARPTSARVGQTGGTTTTFTVGALGLGADTTFSIVGCPNNAECVFASSGTPTSANRSAPWSGDTLIVTATTNTPPGTSTLTVSGGGTTVQVQLVVVPSISRQYLVSIQQ